MTVQERIDQANADLNAATNDIAEDLQKLKDEIANGNISPESLEALENNIAALKAIGQAQ